MSRTAPSMIKGKVFELPEDQQVLSSIDTYEGFDPDHPQSSLFVRKRWPVTLADGSRMMCWIYTYNRNPADAQLIASGSYSPTRWFTQAPECVRAFPFSHSALKTRILLLFLRRFPQLDAISVGIHDPGEAPVIIVFTVRIDLHTFFFQRLQQSVQIVDPIVDHER